MSHIRSNRWLNRVTAIPVMTLAALAWFHAARADAVLDWNAIAADTISTASPPPGPIGFLEMAVVQAAVYDAVHRPQVQTVSRANPGSIRLSGSGCR
jgi:hypothetical protein